MYIERPGSPSATTVTPTSKRRSTSIEIRRSRLASERPPKKGVATKNAFKSGELTAINQIYSRSRNLTAPDRLPGIQEDLASTARISLHLLTSGCGTNAPNRNVRSNDRYGGQSGLDIVTSNPKRSSEARSCH